MEINEDNKFACKCMNLKMQFKIDCIFWKNQDGGHLINGVYITFLL